MKEKAGGGIGAHGTAPEGHRLRAEQQQKMRGPFHRG
jgi:hypothetical protein